MKPFVKWAGGKRQILNEINKYIDDSIWEGSTYTYIEPFLGGGAVFFDRKPQKAIINDLNEDLINAYKVIKSDKYLELIELLDEHSKRYFEDGDEHYYEVRSWDRNDDWPNNYSDVERAARMIFLNRTCYNGLYRVNLKGQFNTPMGRYVNPTICDRNNIIEIHNYLSNNDNQIEIMSKSYEEAIRRAEDGDIIYIDPPYDYEDDDGFTKYQMAGFTFSDFEKLKEECDKAIDKGAIAIISNNATSNVLKLFDEDPRYRTISYNSQKLLTLRNINCKGDSRRTGYEVIILGTPNAIPFPQANDMNKIIKLVMANEEVLIDKSEAKKVIDVETERQVAYYLSALLFFKYITHSKKFTNRAKNIKDDENRIKEDIYKQLCECDLFYDCFKENFNSRIINDEKLLENIKYKNPNMAESTIHRRASTIKAWVKWMFDYEHEKNRML